MKKILLTLVFIFSIGMVKSQTLKFLNELRGYPTINSADKYLTGHGFIIFKSEVIEKNNSAFTMTFFRKESINIDSNAMLSLYKENIDAFRLFHVQYCIHSIKVFNGLKNQCESIPNCIFKSEKTENDGSYTRYFSDGLTTYSFIIYPPKKQGELPMYCVVISP